MNCPLCQKSLPDDSPVPASDGYRACPACGGLFLDPFPRRQANTVFEGEAAVARQAALEEARQAYFLRHLVQVEKGLAAAAKPWRLLEIGCGSGVLLRTARARGWRADALELSPELAALARQNNPEATVTETDVLDQVDGRAQYDAVLALDVLEHVRDPALMLRNCAAHLRPGGLLLVQTPNTASLRARTQGTAWEMRDPSQHLTLFSPRGLSALLERTGFAVHRARTVSGSGQEQGLARMAALGKQSLLAPLRLGNALWVLARRERPQAGFGE